MNGVEFSVSLSDALFKGESFVPSQIFAGTKTTGQFLYLEIIFSIDFLVIDEG